MVEKDREKADALAAMLQSMARIGLARMMAGPGGKQALLVDDREYLIDDHNVQAGDSDVFKWDGEGTPPDDDGYIWRTIVGKKVRFKEGGSIKEAYLKAGLTEDGKRKDDDNTDEFDDTGLDIEYVDLDGDDDEGPSDVLRDVDPKERHWRLNEYEIFKTKEAIAYAQFDKGVKDNEGLPDKEIIKKLAPIRKRYDEAKKRHEEAYNAITALGISNQRASGETIYPLSVLKERGYMDADGEPVGTGSRMQKARPGYIESEDGKSVNGFPITFKPDDEFQARAAKLDKEMKAKEDSRFDGYWSNRSEDFDETVPKKEREKIFAKFNKNLANKRYRPNLEITKKGSINALKLVEKAWSDIPDHIMERFNKFTIKSGFSHGYCYSVHAFDEVNDRKYESVIDIWTSDPSETVRLGHVMRHEIAHSIWNIDYTQKQRNEWSRRIREIKSGITNYAESYRSGPRKNSRSSTFENESMSEFTAIANKLEDDDIDEIQKVEPFNEEVFNAMKQIYKDVMGRDINWKTWEESGYKRGKWDKAPRRRRR